MDTRLKQSISGKIARCYPIERNRSLMAPITPIKTRRIVRTARTNVSHLIAFSSLWRAFLRRRIDSARAKRSMVEEARSNSSSVSFFRHSNSWSVALWRSMLTRSRIDLPPNLVPHLKLGIFHFMFFNVAKFLVLADGYSMSYAAWMCCIQDAIFRSAPVLLSRYGRSRIFSSLISDTMLFLVSLLTPNQLFYIIQG